MNIPEYTRMETVSPTSRGTSNLRLPSANTTKYFKAQNEAMFKAADDIGQTYIKLQDQRDVAVANQFMNQYKEDEANFINEQKTKYKGFTADKMLSVCDEWSDDYLAKGMGGETTGDRVAIENEYQLGMIRESLANENAKRRLNLSNYAAKEIEKARDASNLAAFNRISSDVVMNGFEEASMSELDRLMSALSFDEAKRQLTYSKLYASRINRVTLQDPLSAAKLLVEHKDKMLADDYDSIAPDLYGALVKKQAENIALDIVNDYPGYALTPDEIKSIEPFLQSLGTNIDSFNRESQKAGYTKANELEQKDGEEFLRRRNEAVGSLTYLMYMKGTPGITEEQEQDYAGRITNIVANASSELKPVLNNLVDYANDYKAYLNLERKKLLGDALSDAELEQINEWDAQHDRSKVEELSAQIRDGKAAQDVNFIEKLEELAPQDRENVLTNLGLQYRIDKVARAYKGFDSVVNDGFNRKFTSSFPKNGYSKDLGNALKNAYRQSVASVLYDYENRGIKINDSVMIDVEREASSHFLSENSTLFILSNAFMKSMEDVKNEGEILSNEKIKEIITDNIDDDDDVISSLDDIEKEYIAELMMRGEFFGANQYAIDRYRKHNIVKYNLQNR